MTIIQTVEILADRQLIIDVPPEIPEGKARLEIKLIPYVKEKENPVNKGNIRITKKELDEMLDKSPITRELTGILSDLGDITIEQIRDERLARHLQ